MVKAAGAGAAPAGFLERLQANAGQTGAHPSGRRAAPATIRRRCWRGSKSMPPTPTSTAALADLGKLPERRAQAGASLDRQGQIAPGRACGRAPLRRRRGARARQAVRRAMIRVVLFLHGGRAASPSALPGSPTGPGEVVDHLARLPHRNLGDGGRRSRSSSLVIALMLVWSIVRGILRSPEQVSLFFRHRRAMKGYLAISRGLIAIGAGDLRWRASRPTMRRGCRRAIRWRCCSPRNRRRWPATAPPPSAPSAP